MWKLIARVFLKHLFIFTLLFWKISAYLPENRQESDTIANVEKRQFTVCPILDKTGALFDSNSSTIKMRLLCNKENETLQATKCDWHRSLKNSTVGVCVSNPVCLSNLVHYYI